MGKTKTKKTKVLARTPETPAQRGTRKKFAPVTPDTPTPMAQFTQSKHRMSIICSDSEEDEEILAAGQQPSPLPASSPTLAPSTSPPSLGSPAAVESSSGASPGFPSDIQRKKKRNRWASTNNVLHSYVEHAMVGSAPYRLPQSWALRKGIQYSNGKATNRFKRLMGDVIMQAEKTSHEMGGWIYVVGQHPHAVQAHLSYISPHLRTEASPANLKESHKKIVNMVHSCKVLHRQTAQDLAIQLLAKEEQLEAANKAREAQAEEIHLLKAVASTVQ
ncbi:hypothetical protein C8J56DRAFT_893424 [Mycena floridula]|nr:hypothetical protein C8J56DRAFT_893403 [Mycena floridula]KAJ7583755.1 hypothetical protein C8J56DRAFT_893424 [Mycena floridula]